MADESMDIDDSCYAREVKDKSRAALQTTSRPQPHLHIHNSIRPASQPALGSYHPLSSLTDLPKQKPIGRSFALQPTFAKSTPYNKPATPYPRKRSYELYTQDQPLPIHNLKYRMRPVSGSKTHPTSSTSRSTFATKYPTLARVVPQTPEQQRVVEENIAKAVTPARRIGGMWTSLYNYGRGIASSIWSYICPFDSKQSEIVAVETTTSGSKRRAVGADISPSVMTRTLPGSFPVYAEEPAPASSQAQLHTPPESRPSSSDSRDVKHDSPMADQFIPPTKSGVGSRQASASQASLAQRQKPAPQTNAARPVGRDIATKSHHTEVKGSAGEGGSASVLKPSKGKEPAIRTEREARLAAIREQNLKQNIKPVGRFPSPRYDKTLRRQTLAGYQKAQIKKSNWQKDKELDEWLELCRQELNKALGISEEELNRVPTPLGNAIGRGRKMHELAPWELEAMRKAREKEEHDEYYREKDQRVWTRMFYEEVYKGGREARLAEEARVKAEKQRLKDEKKAREDALIEETRLEIEKLQTEQRLAEEARLGTKQQLIRPLEPEWERKVEDIMGMKNLDSIVGKTVDGADLHRHDIGSLVPAHGDKSPWLNDEVVNGIISAIVSRKLEQTGYVKGPQNVPAYAFMPSQWYNNVTKKGMDSVRTWTRRKGIQGEKLLKCEKVFIPVNTGAHWMLLIISPTTKKLEFLDSLNQRGGTKDKLMNIGREWLKMELGKKYIAEEWTELSSHSAPQQNSDDCGVFTCFNALAAAKGFDFEEVGKGDMGDARRMLAAILLNGGFKDDFEL